MIAYLNYFCNFSLQLLRYIASTKFILYSGGADVKAKYPKESNQNQALKFALNFFKHMRHFGSPKSHCMFSLSKPMVNIESSFTLNKWRIRKRN